MVIERVLPEGVASADTFGEIEEALFDEELSSIEHAVERRVLEFTTVRGCARRALGDLGMARTPMPSESGHGPQWPQGVVGSMTHCEGYRAAAAGYSSQWLSMGIDAEPDLPTPEGVLKEISLPRERRLLKALQAIDPSHAWDRLLFSAKESVYKAWWPVMRRWLGFEEVVVMIDRLTGVFTVHAVSDNARTCPMLDGAHGRWLADQGHLVTALVLPSLDSGRRLSRDYLA